MNFYYKWIVYIINKLQLTIWYHINLSIFRQDNIQFREYISIPLDKYTYKNIILI